jgi:hypothetical protein
MTDTPLHNHDDVHLYDGDFTDLVADLLRGEEDLLVAAPESDIVDDVLQSLKDTYKIEPENVETYTGDQSELPFDEGSFHSAVHINPGRGVLQRHLPLYEMTAVVRNGGEIIYRAPNYLAHSTAVDINTLYALNWQDHENPTVAGHLQVTEEGDPRASDSSTVDEQTATLGDF